MSETTRKVDARELLRINNKINNEYYNTIAGILNSIQEENIFHQDFYID